MSKAAGVAIFFSAVTLVLMFFAVQILFENSPAFEEALSFPISHR